MVPTPHHVIILGCGRSGTSIFGELFEHLPHYTYHSEPPFADLSSYDYSAPVAVKVPKESPGFPPSLGLSLPWETLLATVPEPRTVYWQVRHPLDTICSLRVGIAQQWGHHPKPPDWQVWLGRPLLERCAHHWNYINSVGWATVKGWVVVNHFEDMLANPRAFAERVAGQVQLEATQHAAALDAWAQRVQNTNNKQFEEAKTSREYSRPDHTVRVDRWKENLSKADLAKIIPIVRATAARHGYLLD
jgi:hypothetical protein